MLQITHHAEGACTVLKLSGPVDAVTAPVLSEALQQHVTRRPHKLVIDAAGVAFASSAGLRVLIIGVKAARGHGGDLRVAAVQPAVLKVLQLAGFTQLIQTFGSTAEAVKSFG